MSATAVHDQNEEEVLTVSKFEDFADGVIRAAESLILDLEPYSQANAFPLLGDDERERLKQSIKDEGCREPLDWWLDPEGHPWLIDGRNRQSICKELGIQPEARLFTGTAEDVARFIVSRNITRRHQSKRSQIIAVGQMVLFNPDLAGSQRDRRKVVAELGRFAASTVRYYLEKDLTPTKAATLEERAEKRRAEKEAVGGDTSHRERAEPKSPSGFEPANGEDPDEWADEQAERDTEAARPSGDIYRDLATASDAMAGVRGALGKVSHRDESKRAEIEAGRGYAKDAHRAIKLALLSLHRAGMLDGSHS